MAPGTDDLNGVAESTLAEEMGKSDGIVGDLKGGGAINFQDPEVENAALHLNANGVNGHEYMKNVGGVDPNSGTMSCADGESTEGLEDSDEHNLGFHALAVQRTERPEIEAGSADKFEVENGVSEIQHIEKSADRIEVEPAASELPHTQNMAEEAKGSLESTSTKDSDHKLMHSASDRADENLKFEVREVEEASGDLESTSTNESNQKLEYGTCDATDKHLKIEVQEAMNSAKKEMVSAGSADKFKVENGVSEIQHIENSADRIEVEPMVSEKTHTQNMVEKAHGDLESTSTEESDHKLECSICDTDEHPKIDVQEVMNYAEIDMGSAGNVDQFKNGVSEIQIGKSADGVEVVPVIYAIPQTDNVVEEANDHPESTSTNEFDLKLESSACDGADKLPTIEVREAMNCTEMDMGSAGSTDQFDVENGFSEIQQIEKSAGVTEVEPLVSEIPQTQIMPEEANGIRESSSTTKSDHKLACCASDGADENLKIKVQEAMNCAETEMESAGSADQFKIENGVPEIPRIENSSDRIEVEPAVSEIPQMQNMTEEANGDPESTSTNESEHLLACSACDGADKNLKTEVQEAMYCAKMEMESSHFEEAEATLQDMQPGPPDENKDNEMESSHFKGKEATLQNMEPGSANEIKDNETGSFYVECKEATLQEVEPGAPDDIKDNEMESSHFEGEEAPLQYMQPGSADETEDNVDEATEVSIEELKSRSSLNCEDNPQINLNKDMEIAAPVLEFGSSKVDADLKITDAVGDKRTEGNEDGAVNGTEIQNPSAEPALAELVGEDNGCKLESEVIYFQENHSLGEDISPSENSPATVDSSERSAPNDVEQKHETSKADGGSEENQGEEDGYTIGTGENVAMADSVQASEEKVEIQYILSEQEKLLAEVGLAQITVEKKHESVVKSANDYNDSMPFSYCNGNATTDQELSSMIGKDNPGGSSSFVNDSTPDECSSRQVSTGGSYSAVNDSAPNDVEQKHETNKADGGSGENQDEADGYTTGTGENVAIADLVLSETSACEVKVEMQNILSEQEKLLSEVALAPITVMKKHESVVKSTNDYNDSMPFSYCNGNVTTDRELSSMISKGSPEGSSSFVNDSTPDECSSRQVSTGGPYSAENEHIELQVGSFIFSTSNISDVIGPINYVVSDDSDVTNGKSRVGHDSPVLARGPPATVERYECNLKHDENKLMCPEEKNVARLHYSARDYERQNLDGRWETTRMRKQFYIVKVPRFSDDGLWAEIQHAALDLDRKTDDRDAITELINKQKQICEACEKELLMARTDERTVRVSYHEKRQQFSDVQMNIEKLNRASSIEDIDEAIEMKERSMQHETLTLKQEKQALRELSEMKAQRNQICSEMGSKTAFDNVVNQKDRIYELRRTVREELEAAAKALSECDERSKAAQKKCHENYKILEGLRKQFLDANEVRQRAYKNWRDLKNNANKSNDYFFSYKEARRVAAEYNSKHDIEELQMCCSDQVENFMQQWNRNEEFRAKYVESIKTGTLRTFKARDIGHSKDVTVLLADSNNNMKITLPPPSVSSKAKSENLIQEAASAANSDSFLVLQAAKHSPPKLNTVSRNGGTDGISSEVVEISERCVVNTKSTSKELEPAGKTEETTLPKEDELERERAAETEKEKLRLEQRAKALEAEERKKRKADKAQQKAELRAQKKAEIREKKKANKDKKKPDPGNVVPGTSTASLAVDHGESSRAFAIPQETSEMPASSSVRHSRPPRAAKHLSRVQPLPMPLRNKNKRKVRPWMIVALMLLLVTALFFGTKYFTITGFGSFYS